MDMAGRIKERRTAMGYTQEELGEKIGVQKSAIAKYENGRVKNLKRGVIAKLADALQCSPTYLMGLEEENNDMKLSNIIPITTHKLPMLGEIACGEPRFTNENRESYVDAGTNIKADFCLKAKGDSMINARIMDGDVVFIRRQPVVENGEIAAVAIDDEATLKRFPQSRARLRGNKIRTVGTCQSSDQMLQHSHPARRQFRYRTATASILRSAD